MGGLICVQPPSLSPAPVARCPKGNRCLRSCFGRKICGTGHFQHPNRHQAFSPNKPFLMYWTLGVVHGPQHVFSEWAGLTLYLDEGKLVYEYNMLLLERYRAETSEPLSPGEHTIEVDTTLAKPGAPATVILKVDGKELARTIVERTVPLAFTASETFDVGVDLGAPVSLDYAERRPFEFNGTIKRVSVLLQ